MSENKHKTGLKDRYEILMNKLVDIELFSSGYIKKLLKEAYELFKDCQVYNVNEHHAISLIVERARREKFRSHLQNSETLLKESFEREIVRRMFEHQLRHIETIIDLLEEELNKRE